MRGRPRHPKANKKCCMASARYTKAEMRRFKKYAEEMDWSVSKAVRRTSLQGLEMRERNKKNAADPSMLTPM